MQTIIVKGDLKKLRKKAKLTFRELGKLSGVNFAHLCHIEQGLPTTQETWNKIKIILDKYAKKYNTTNSL